MYESKKGKGGVKRVGVKRQTEKQEVGERWAKGQGRGKSQGEVQAW